MLLGVQRTGPTTFALTARHDPDLIRLKRNPIWNGLSSEPEFHEIERRIGLP